MLSNAECNMDVRTESMPRKPAGAPLLSVRAWCCVIGVCMALNAAYVLSWPFVMDLTATETSYETPRPVAVPGPPGAAPVLIDGEYELDPVAYSVYWPLNHATCEADVPIVTPVLEWYNNLVLGWLDYLD